MTSGTEKEIRSGEIWFIRHGESTTNAGEVSKDKFSTQLTALGREQAKAVSLAVPRAPELIVVTPYIRTQQTALPLEERFPASPREIWDLHEFSALGDANYINRTWTERIPVMQDFWERCDPDFVDGDGAESFSAMARRVRAGLEKLQRREESFTVVFSHGYIIQTIRLMLSHPGLPEKELMQRLAVSTRTSHIENCTITRVLKTAQGLSLHAETLESMDKGLISEHVD